MPEFGNPFSGLSLDRPLSKEELIRSIRFMLSAEYEAVEMYGRVADATSDEKIKKAIMDIVEEERVHAGEFLKMLSILDPEEAKLYQEGFKEVEEGMGKQSISGLLRVRAGKVYEWQKIKDHPELKDWDKKNPELKTMMYKSPFTGKKYHVSPSAADESIDENLKKKIEAFWRKAFKERWQEDIKSIDIKKVSTKRPGDPDLEIDIMFQGEHTVKVGYSPESQKVFSFPYTIDSAYVEGVTVIDYTKEYNEK
jgi:rubrerythrin